MYMYICMGLCIISFILWGGDDFFGNLHDQSETI